MQIGVLDDETNPGGSSDARGEDAPATPTLMAVMLSGHSRKGQAANHGLGKQFGRTSKLSLPSPRPGPQVVAHRQSRCDMPVHPVVGRQKGKQAKHCPNTVRSGSEGCLTIGCVQEDPVPGIQLHLPSQNQKQPKSNSPALSCQAIDISSRTSNYCTVSLPIASSASPSSLSKMAAQARTHSVQM